VVDKKRIIAKRGLRRRWRYTRGLLPIKGKKVSTWV
jgi:hypothetical protein